MKRYELILAPHERAALKEAVLSHAKPYMRERAAALLKVADGCSCRAVARAGLLRVRDPDTVRAWCARYVAERSIQALEIRPGRGRKPRFPPL